MVGAPDPIKGSQATKTVISRGLCWHSAGVLSSMRRLLLAIKPGYDTGNQPENLASRERTKRTLLNAGEAGWAVHHHPPDLEGGRIRRYFYEAGWEEKKTSVALKVLRDNADRYATSLFNTEARILARTGPA